MPKHTSLSCQQVAANNEQTQINVRAAQKSQVETKRAKKASKKVTKEAIEDSCDHCDGE